MRYSAFGDTHVGKVRDHNEDAFFVSENGGFFLVSDGMGGLSAGEVASKITKDVIEKTLDHGANQNVPFDKLLRDAFVQANIKVRRTLIDNPSVKGMGCTCVVLAFRENDFYIGYVGDSRIYLFRNNHLKQITRDHSYVEELFLRGLITAEEKKDHPYKSSITRYIGHSDTIEVDITSGPVSNNDIFILCSDGLTGEVEDSAIEEILKNNIEPQKCVPKLIQKALDSGGSDNISIIAVKVEKKNPGFFKKLFSW
ncbi:MAG: Stp1/IreP family PP2C-type Ser/Thr phosphatase [Erysipelotrichia bacterium]|nr:Stp1/IreP family PP2C-type Ser/Thr phosphatase [Candidatus Riflebacteria bacterium]NCB39347.1 Stp1/IreP family PP2C-type Ser/Thr phosphatase [Erysipelotrichia bacterium]